MPLLISLGLISFVEVAYVNRGGSTVYVEVGVGVGVGEINFLDLN